MATQRSAKNPHQWPNGEWHSIPWTQTKQYQQSQYAKGNPGPGPLGPPPVGTYDPAIDYNAGASQRGYQSQVDDAATAYQQGQEDYGLDLGDLDRGRNRGIFSLTRSRDRTLEDLNRDETRLNEDFRTATANLHRQFGILGRQQSERAAQQGVTSAGLLGKSAQVRGENQNREQILLNRQRQRGADDIGRDRTRTTQDFQTGMHWLGQDYQSDRTRLGLGFGRTFGGYGGNTFNNPLTGQPMVGTLLTSLTRAGGENNAFQTLSDQQRSQQARDFGYIAPGVIPTTPTRDATAEFTRRIRGR